jgi:hypothetical protein
MLQRKDIPHPTPTERRKRPPPTTQFEQDLQAAIDDGQVLQLNADITLEQPVRIKIRHSHQGWFGLDGGFHKIHSTVQGEPALSFVMPEDLHGVCARGFFLGNLSMLGDGNEEGGLVVDAIAGDSWLVNAELRSIWIEGMGGKAAIICAGNVFESSWYNVSTMDNKGAGIYFANRTAGAIVSAMHLYGGTQRSNDGAGILIDQYDGPGDISVHGMYFCENKGGGYHSWAGCELLDKCGFENNSEFGINVQNYCHMRRCTGSTHGTQPLLVIGYLANPWVIDDCAMVGYSGGEPRFGQFTGNGQRLTLRGKYDSSLITIGQGVDLVFAP